MIDEITKINLLYDFYGQLLTQRQQEVFNLYHEENLSLGEIAEEFDISRQGVHDALKKAEQSLDIFEKKLGLIARFEESQKAIAQIDTKIDKIMNSKTIETETKKELQNIKDIIDRLNY